MPETRTVMFEGKPNVFPADFTDAEISSALGAIPASNSASVPKARTWTDVAVDAIPAIAGTAGAMIGGAGGTVLGFGVGGVPGAAGGAAVGTAGGEALKQLINHGRNLYAGTNVADVPRSDSEAASQIAVPAAEAGVGTAVLGGMGKFLAPRAGAMLSKGGKVLAESPSWRQLAGQAMQDAGDAMTPASAMPKPTMSAVDVLRVQALKKAGMPEADAVKRVLQMKIEQAVAAAARIK